MIRPISIFIFTLAVLICSSLPSHAQQPPPDPPAQQPTVVQIGRSRSLGEQVAWLAVRVRQMMPALSNEMMILKGWIEYWSLVLMLVVILGSGLREWHENNGEGRNLFWWFGRLACCLLLFGSGTVLIDQLYVIGKDIAEGNESFGQTGQSRLFEFYKEQRDSFNTSYEKLVDGHFTVKVKEQEEFTVQPIDGTEKILGVIYDQGTTIKDLNNNLQDSSYSLPLLFGLMSFARGIMEVGDVWLSVLGGLLLMAFKVLAPLMIVLAIDRKLSQRAVHAYVRGLIVITLFWPSVSYFLRSLAYLAGNASMSAWDTDQVYAWTAATMTTLRDPLAQPVITIAFGSLLMLGAGLALIISPYFAYAFSMGRVFESVSQTATQTAASFAGLAAEAWNSLVGSRISRQADNLQIEGAYDSETVRAGADWRSADFGAMARREQALGQAKAQKEATMGGIWANWAYQWGTTRNQRDFAVSAAEGQGAYSKLLDLNRNAKELRDIGIGTEQQVKNISAQGISEVAHGAGAGLGAGARGGGGGAAGAVAGAGLGQLGSAAKFKLQADAAVDAMNKRLDNTTRATDQNLDIHDQYRDFTIANQRALASNQESTVNISTGHAIDGANRTYGIQVGAANRVYNLETEANKIRFEGQMDAAEITRKAGLDAANLRAMGQVYSSVMSKLVRDIEKNAEMRF